MVEVTSAKHEDYECDGQAKWNPHEGTGNKTKKQKQKNVTQ